MKADAPQLSWAKTNTLRLLVYVTGLFPGFKTEEGTWEAWADCLSPIGITFDEAKAAARRMSSAGDWPSPGKLIEHWHRLRGEKAEKVYVKTVRREELLLLSPEQFENARRAPSSENYQLNGREYFRTTAAGTLIYEHNLKKKNPTTYKLISELSNGKQSVSYRS